MKKKITKAIEFIKLAGLKEAVLAIPFPICAKDLAELRDIPVCKGFILHNPSPEITASSSGDWLGRFEGYGWILPFTRAPIVFVGSHLQLTTRMVVKAVRCRRFPVFCMVNGRYQQLPLLRFALWRIGEKLLRGVNQLKRNHPLRGLAELIKKIPPFRYIWRRVFKQENFSSRTFGNASGRSGIAEESLYRELLLRARKSSESSGFQAIPRRVLLVNAGLAAGGAERQIVNTLIGLRDAGQCESVGLLAEYIDYAQHLDFFLPELETAGIEVSQVEHSVSLSDYGLFSAEPQVAELLVDIPSGLIEEILNLVAEFRSRKPEVVHAWQDSSSIKAGIAAVIAGVPRIVLASRNVTPINFTYYQDWMRPAYRALAGLENVKFINNSEAGALDYTKWLELPRERFNVLRNGVDLTSLQRAGSEDVSRYRHTLGIPQSARVVGSVFRFWAEKRPMLWLEVASQIARQFSDVHFLIVGEGPLRPQMEKFIQRNGLIRRVHLPGARPDVVPALSAMDIFLLTSEFEGTPNVVLEAQWLGLPIVATDSGGTRESFADGETGLLATQADPAEIAKLVATLLYNESLVKAYAQKGREFVASKFGVTRMIQETLNIYGLGAVSDYPRNPQRNSVHEAI